MTDKPPEESKPQEKPAPDPRPVIFPRLDLEETCELEIMTAVLRQRRPDNK